MRNVCLGLCAVVARFGGVLAPYVVLLGSIHTLLPIVIFGLIAMISGALTCILPETKECILPSSLDEAVQIKYQLSNSSSCQEPNLPTTSSTEINLQKN
uniref:MFS domain-containing protein n=1 Tax=Elaeophora elaphi TaxID=1147741 RepID=A0A0R3S3L4_9BILA